MHFQPDLRSLKKELGKVDYIPPEVKYTGKRSTLPKFPLKLENFKMSECKPLQRLKRPEYIEPEATNIEKLMNEYYFTKKDHPFSDTMHFLVWIMTPSNCKITGLVQHICETLDRYGNMFVSRNNEGEFEYRKVIACIVIPMEWERGCRTKDKEKWELLNKEISLLSNVRNITFSRNFTMDVFYPMFIVNNNTFIKETESWDQVKYKETVCCELEKLTKHFTIVEDHFDVGINFKKHEFYKQNGISQIWRRFSEIPISSRKFQGFYTEDTESPFVQDEFSVVWCALGKGYIQRERDLIFTTVMHTVKSAGKRVSYINVTDASVEKFMNIVYYIIYDDADIYDQEKFILYQIQQSVEASLCLLPKSLVTERMKSEFRNANDRMKDCIMMEVLRQTSTAMILDLDVKITRNITSMIAFAQQIHVVQHKAAVEYAKVNNLPSVEYDEFVPLLVRASFYFMVKRPIFPDINDCMLDIVICCIPSNDPAFVTHKIPSGNSLWDLDGFYLRLNLPSILEENRTIESIKTMQTTKAVDFRTQLLIKHLDLMKWGYYENTYKCTPLDAEWCNVVVPDCHTASNLFRNTFLQHDIFTTNLMEEDVENINDHTKNAAFRIFHRNNIGCTMEEINDLHYDSC